MKKTIFIMYAAVLSFYTLNAQNNTTAKWVRHNCGLLLNNQSYSGNLSEMQPAPTSTAIRIMPVLCRALRLLWIH